MMAKSYILTSWVNALLSGLKNDGCDIDKILIHAGVAADSLDQGYCSLSKLQQVFDSAQLIYGDYLGVSSNKGVTPSSFQSLSISILTSKNLYDGFSLLAKHNQIITNVLDFVVDDKQGGRFGFYIEDGYEISLPLVGAVLGRAMRTASFIQPGSFLITHISFAYSRPENADSYEKYFGATIEWEAEVNAVYFNNSIFFSDSIHANEQLCQSAEKSWLKEVSTSQQLDFMQRVKTYISSHISEGRITVQSAADHFDMSVRTFQRRLDDSQISFSDLVLGVRRDESKALLSCRASTVTETAYSLGFSDAASFSRAFKRWFGLSPEQYRKSLC